MREAILKFECGFSRAELANCVREINSIKNQRRQTVSTLQHAAMQERMEELRNKMSCGRTSTDLAIQKLWEDAARVAALSE